MYITKTSDVEPKLIAIWNKGELFLNNLNYQGLHLLTSSVTTEDLSLISKFTTSKEECDFSEKNYDGCSSQIVVSTPKKL